MKPLKPSGDTAARPINANPTCPIEEYPINLLMLLWAIAPKAPIIIDPAERKTSTNCHLSDMPPKTSNKTLANIAPIASFGTIAINAVTGVGDPS